MRQCIPELYCWLQYLPNQVNLQQVPTQLLWWNTKRHLNDNKQFCPCGSGPIYLFFFFLQIISHQLMSSFIFFHTHAAFGFKRKKLYWRTPPKFQGSSGCNWLETTYIVLRSFKREVFSTLKEYLHPGKPGRETGGSNIKVDKWR